MNEKIQKILSHRGHGSRRKIEKIIESGNILLNNKKVVIGQRLDTNNFHQIQIYGKIVSITKTLDTKVLIYNKPEGEICTRYDCKKRRTVFHKLPIVQHQRWINVGRLDINTSGLLLFTNNGNLANQLMHPRNQIEREYYIRVFGKINTYKMNLLQTGVNIKHGDVAFKNIQLINAKKSSKNQWLKGIICEGKNREIRLMFKKIKCTVSRLIRIRYGNILLPKKLPLGQYTELNSASISQLYQLISKE